MEHSYDPDCIKIIPNDYSKFAVLNTNVKEIRLVCLRPQIYGDELVVYILSASLSDEPPSIYQCLSYWWGDLTDTEIVTIVHLDKKPNFQKDTHRGDPFTITKELGNALRRLRHKEDALLIWIDAICINQSDHRERTSQIRLMNEIYSTASSVLAWIGEASPDDQLAANCMVSIPNGYKNKAAPEEDWLVGPNGFRCAIPSMDLPENGPVDGHESGTLALVTALAAFFLRPWFWRVWVLQEVAVSRKAVMYYGDMAFPWGSVLTLANFMSERLSVFYHYTVERYPERKAGHLPEIWTRLAKAGYSQRPSMIDLLLTSRELKATDPRDNIYALLGLAKECGRDCQHPFEVSADYTISRAEVFNDFTRKWIAHSKRTDILSAAEAFGGHRSYILESLATPSWAISFVDGTEHVRTLSYQALYEASGNTTASLSPYSEPGILSLEGVRVDYPITISPELVTDITGMNLWFVLDPDADALTSLWTRIASKARYDEADLLQAYMLTLTGGFGRRNHQVTFNWDSAGNYAMVYPPEEDDLRRSRGDFARYWMAKNMSFKGIEPKWRLQLQRWEEDSGPAWMFGQQVRRLCHNRRLCLSRCGLLGLCPKFVESGDIIVVLNGSSVPSILRPTSQFPSGLSHSASRAAKLPKFKFVGECYLHGVMGGEAMDFKRRYHIPSEMFHLV